MTSTNSFPESNSETIDLEESILSVETLAIRDSIKQHEIEIDRIKGLAANDRELQPPKSFKVKKAKKQLSNGRTREERYGFITVKSDDLADIQDVVTFTDTNFDTVSRGLQKNPALFVHSESVNGRFFDGDPIVPREIKATDKGFTVVRADSPSAFVSNTQYRLVQAQLDIIKKEKDEYQHAVMVPFEHEIRENIKATDLLLYKSQIEPYIQASLDRDSVWVHDLSATFPTTTLWEKLECIKRIGNYYNSKNNFSTECVKNGGYINQAIELEAQLKTQGIIVRTDVWSYDHTDYREVTQVSLKFDIPNFDAAAQSYRDALEADIKLRMDFDIYPNDAGKYTAATFGYVSYDMPGGMYSQSEGSEVSSFEVTSQPNKPEQNVVLWKRAFGETPVDKLADVSQIVRTASDLAKHWENQKQMAQAELAALIADKELKIKNTQEAMETLQWLINKMPLPYNPEMGEKQLTWLGIPVTAVKTEVWQSMKGMVPLYFCYLQLQDGGKAVLDDLKDMKAEDLIQYPDFISLVATAKREWDNQQPVETIIPDESVEEAVYRLQESLYSLDKLPVIDGLVWLRGYEAIRTESVLTEEKVKKMGVLVVDEKRDEHYYYTHALMLIDKSGKTPDVELSALYFYAGQRIAGWHPRLEGLPHYKLTDYLKDHSSIVDPRTLYIEYQPLKPSDTL